MRSPFFTALWIAGILLVPAVVMAQGVRSKVKMPSCEAVCAGLVDSIRQNPAKLVIRLEDALVINESCTADIVTAAIDAVSADPRQVQIIVETAMNVVPHRAQQVHLAVTNFSVPAAVVASEEVFEVRRAELPDGQAQPVYEVRRAESAHLNEHAPLEEIRRAVLAESIEEVRNLDVAGVLKDVPKAKRVTRRSKK
jgi:hypothetical protein